ncbi:MAG: hypothetical protein GY757_33030 [bacterium]|nr:hypothetical protein [bacterium]
MIYKNILFVIILLLTFGYSSAEKKSKFNIFIQTGASFPTYPEAVADDFSPALNVGCGVGMALSSRFTLQVAVQYYSFKSKDEYARYITICGSLVELPGDGFYVGDLFHAFYNGIVRLKFNALKSRLSPYLVAGAGVTVIRNPYGWYRGIEGRINLVGTSIYYIIEGGIGLDYRLNKNFRLFLEASDTLAFFKDRERNYAAIPLKAGVIYNF